MGMDKLTRIHQRATIMVRIIARSERLREAKSSCTQGPAVDTKSLEVGEGHKAIAEPALVSSDPLPSNLQVPSTSTNRRYTISS
jgi:hypothetical protein